MADFKNFYNIFYYLNTAKIHGDCAYAMDRCKLDIAAPVDKKNLSVIIFFHGGGLSMGEKSFPPSLLDGQFVVVAVNYRLSGAAGGRCPDYIEDAAAAVAWTLHHIDAYGGNPDNCYLIGESGGAYLVAMLGLVDSYLQTWGIDRCCFSGIFPVSGQLTTHFQILNERNNTNQIVPPKHLVIDEFAPIYHIQGESSPIICITGDRTLDWPGRAEENQLFAAQMRRVGGNLQVEAIELSGFDHGSVSEAAISLFKRRAIELNRKKLLGKTNWDIDLSQGTFSADLSNRMGEKVKPSSSFELTLNGNELRVTLRESGDDQEEAGNLPLWQRRHWELFFAPRFTTRTQCLQLGIDDSGDFCWIGCGLKIAQDPRLTADIISTSNGKEIKFTLSLKELGMTPQETAAFNVFRYYTEQKQPMWQNWVPTCEERNLVTESFGRLILH